MTPNKGKDDNEREENQEKEHKIILRKGKKIREI